MAAAGPKIVQLCTLLQKPGLFSRALDTMQIGERN